MKKIIIYLISFLVISFGLYKIFPYFIKVELKEIPFSHIIYDTNNIEIGEIVVDGKYRHIYKKIDEYPEFLKNSIISIEDKNFYKNDGLDYFAILRAIKNNFLGETIEGASTISTQVIRNSYWLNENRGIKLKIKEFVLSLALNKKFEKKEILEYYLNNINFGYLNYGFESASRFYFNKEINNLTKAEIISLITIIKNSNKYNPIDNPVNFRKRYEILTNYLYKNGVINEREKVNILEEKLSFNKGVGNKLPYVTDFLKNQKINSKENNIITTIDYNLTKEIEKIGKTGIESLAWKNVGDYSVLIIDRKTGELKVMIGGVNYGGKNGQVNSTLALRQPGSTLKPFLYLLAFKNLGLNKESTILDLPVQYPTKDGNLYSPKNYSLDYRGEVSLAESLSQSINIPAVKLLNQVGIQTFINFLRELKITSVTKDSDYYGLSLALGSAEMNLYELTRAYSIFANAGELCSTVIIKGEKKDCTKIIDKKYINEINDILTNRYFKIQNFPINSNLDFGEKDIFAKSGTSRNFKDNWILGISEDYIIGVWAGNKDGSEMKGVSGVSGAGEIFKKIITYIDNSKSTNISKINYDGKKYFEITSPLKGSIYKIDKSIPINEQKIKIETSSNIDYDTKKMFINEKEINSEFLNIKDYLGNNIIKIQLYKNNNLIGENVSNFEIKNN